MLQQLIVLFFTLMCIPALGSSAAADVKAQAAEQVRAGVAVPKAVKKLRFDDVFPLIDCVNEKVLAAALQENAVDLTERASEQSSAYGIIGYNPLLYAMTSLRYAEEPARALRKMELLIQHGSDVEAASTNWYTPIMASALMLSPESIRLLVKYHADPLKKNNRGQGALHALYNHQIAATRVPDFERRQRMTARMLVVLGLDVDERDENQLTPLQHILTAHSVHYEGPAAELLVEYGANPNMQDCAEPRIAALQSWGTAKYYERFIREEIPGQLAAAHERFKVAMQEQMMRLQAGMRQAFQHAPGYEVLYQDPKGIIPIINGYVGRTLFSAAEDPLIAETVGFMERNQAAAAAAPPKQ